MKYIIFLDAPQFNWLVKVLKLLPSFFIVFLAIIFIYIWIKIVKWIIKSSIKEAFLEMQNDKLYDKNS